MVSFPRWTGAPDVLHLLFVFPFVFAFFFARFFLDRFVFRRVAMWLLGVASLPSNDRTARTKKNSAVEAKIAKCSESMWKLAYYASVETWVLMITYQEPWFKDTQEYFKGWPNQELKFPLSLYYMCQCGFYIYGIFALLTWETRRKDCPVMMSHHVVTIILIQCSYLTGFFRIGSIILALHDGSDVLMEAAKMFKYSGNELGASVFFGMFAVSWLLLRLIFFPFWVIRASSYDFLRYLDVSKTYEKTLYYVFNTLLLMLLLFHIYWWHLICSMIIRQLKNRGQVGEDIRSDSEDED